MEKLNVKSSSLVLTGKINLFQIIVIVIIPFDAQIKSITVQMKHGTFQKLIQFGEN